jgi:hypothetical protein
MFVYGAIRGNASPANSQILVREVLKCLKQKLADVAIFEYVPTESALYDFVCTAPQTFFRDHFPLRQGHVHACSGFDRRRLAPHVWFPHKAAAR